MFKRLIIMIVFAGLYTSLYSQQSPQQYYPETDPVVLEKLEKWQDLKLGLLMHWGAYSQWGIVESWSLCSEDVGWTRRTKGEGYNHETHSYFTNNYFPVISFMFQSKPIFGI